MYFADSNGLPSQYCHHYPWSCVPLPPTDLFLVNAVSLPRVLWPKDGEGSLLPPFLEVLCHERAFWISRHVSFLFLGKGKCDGERETCVSCFKFFFLSPPLFFLVKNNGPHFLFCALHISPPNDPFKTHLYTARFHFFSLSPVVFFYCIDYSFFSIPIPPCDPQSWG